MAVVTDRKTLYEKQLQNIQKQIEDNGMDIDNYQQEIDRLKFLIEEEQNKSKRYQIENIRRKHNYLPLIVEILKVLAKEKKLMHIYEKAKERTLKNKKQKKK